MESVNLKYVYKLANGDKHPVTIKDVNPSITESEVLLLGNGLIAKGCHYNGSLFESLEKSSKITISEEIY